MYLFSVKAIIFFFVFLFSVTPNLTDFSVKPINYFFFCNTKYHEFSVKTAIFFISFFCNSQFHKFSVKTTTLFFSFFFFCDTPFYFFLQDPNSRNFREKKKVFHFETFNYTVFNCICLQISHKNYKYQVRIRSFLGP